MHSEHVPSSIHLGLTLDASVVLGFLSINSDVKGRYVSQAHRFGDACPSKCGLLQIWYDGLRQCPCRVERPCRRKRLCRRKPMHSEQAPSFSSSWTLGRHSLDTTVILGFSGVSPDVSVVLGFNVYSQVRAHSCEHRARTPQFQERQEFPEASTL